MKNAVFWDVTRCGSCRSRRFRGCRFLQVTWHNNPEDVILHGCVSVLRTLVILSDMHHRQNPLYSTSCLHYINLHATLITFLCRTQHLIHSLINCNKSHIHMILRSSDYMNNNISYHSFGIQGLLALLSSHFIPGLIFILFGGLFEGGGACYIIRM
jgi:hypothetical protein